MADDRKLVRNAIRCNRCGDIIESTYTHDFRWCSCGAVAVDGGLEYEKRLGERADWTEMSEYEPPAEDAQLRGLARSVISYGGPDAVRRDAAPELVQEVHGIGWNP